MKSKNWFISLGMCVTATILVLSVGAVSQASSCCASSSDSHGNHTAAANQHGVASCPMAKADEHTKHEPNMVDEKTCSSELMQKYQFLATMPIYMDGPTVLYASAQELGLSEEQKAKLLAITAESRRNALAVLTAEQRKQLGVISDEPITMSQICPMMRSEKSDHHAAKPAETTKTAEQTVCPVMGGAINKSIFTEYQNKKVYFCCPVCVDKFKAEPEKYLPKLPQFKK